VWANAIGSRAMNADDQQVGGMMSPPTSTQSLGAESRRVERIGHAIPPISPGR
jgi:hypothetical protein